MTKLRIHIDIIDTARIPYLLAHTPTRLDRRNDLLPSHIVLKMLQNQLGSTGTATACLKVSAKWLLPRLLQALLARSAHAN